MTSFNKLLFLFLGLLFIGMIPLHAQTLSQNALQKIVNAESIEQSLSARNFAPVVVILNLEMQKFHEITPDERSLQQLRIRESQDLVLAELEGLQSVGVKRFNSFPYLGISGNRDVIEKLAESPHVRAIIPNELSRPHLTESAEQIGAPRMWDSGYTGEGRTIVILDTGVDVDHLFFGDRIVDGACFSSTFLNEEPEPETAEENGNGNGDSEPDLYSETLCVNVENEPVSSAFGIDAGRNCDVGVDSFCDHGTHVAGIAAGGDAFVEISGEPTPISGVAKGANIFPIQVFSLIYDESFCGSGDPCVGSFFTDQIRALEHILEYNDDPGNSPLDFSSINMSLGGGSFDAICDEISDGNGGTIPEPRKAVMDALKAANIATIVSSGNAGNPGEISAPACISTAISVGSVTKSDAVSNFSNAAGFLDLLAPGSSIRSSVLNNQVGFKSGTSMAAPHVAGVWALLNQAYPEKNVDEILTILKDTGVQITDTRNSLVFPRIQIDEAASQDFIAEIGDGSLVGEDGEGWRFLSSPVLSSYSDLLSTIWTQGSVNSKGPSVLLENSNVLIYNGSVYEPVSDLSTPINMGSGMAVYVYADDNFDGSENDWGKPLEVRGPAIFGDVEVDHLLFDGATEDEVYSLLGNPFETAIDFDEFIKNSSVGNIVYVYDYSFSESDTGFSEPDEPGGTSGGAFRAWNGSTGSLNGGLIAPFQGFFIFSDGANPELTIPQSSKVDPADVPFYKEREEDPVIRFAARINGSHIAETWVSFTPEGSVERTSYDAPLLYPLDFKPFLSLYTKTDETLFNIKTLPLEFEAPVRIPVDLQAWQPNGNSENPGYVPLTGTVELVWPKFEHIPQNWTVTLSDQLTGENINLRTAERYIFETGSSPMKINSIPYELRIQPAKSITEGESRFILNIHPFPVDDPSIDELPGVVNLSQNYPNPFNPSTQIRYELPQESNVTLDVYSIEGQLVATLVNSVQPAGMHTVHFDGSRLASGVYLYRLTAGNNMLSKKMILIK